MKMMVMKRNVGTSYPKEYNQLLSRWMKTTVILRREGDCYLRDWRRLFSQGTKHTPIWWNKDDCYPKEWRWLWSHGVDSCYLKEWDSCHVKEWTQLLSQGMKTTVVSKIEGNYYLVEGWCFHLKEQRDLAGTEIVPEWEWYQSKTKLKFRLKH